MGDIVTLHQERGMERTWVPAAEEEFWVAHWNSHGVIAARWRDYRAWGGFFPPHPETAGDVMLYPATRKHRRLARK